MNSNDHPIADPSGEAVSDDSPVGVSSSAPSPVPRSFRHSPRAVRWLSVAVLLATFLAGVVTGVGLQRWTGPPLPPPPGFLPRVPLEALDLSEHQWTQVREIVDRRRPELEAILKDTFPRVREINEQIEREVREVLTPEQKAKFDELKARRPGPPPGGHPPGRPGPWGPRPPHGAPPPHPYPSFSGPPPGLP